MNFNKHVLGALILSALTLNANATEIEENTLEIMPKFKVLPLNYMGKSFVFDALEDKFDIQSQAPLSFATNDSQSQPSAQIASYDAVLLDAQYLTSEDKIINSHLKEAYAQGKTIIIENGNNLVDNKVDQIFPILVENDIVIIRPSDDGGDNIYSYDAVNSDDEVGAVRSIVGDSYKGSSTYQYNPNDTLYEVTLNSLSGEKRQELISDVIRDLLSTKTAASDIAKKDGEPAVSQATGGLLSNLSCPQVLTDANQCFVAFVNSNSYSYNGIVEGVAHDEDGTNNIAVVMYKDNLGKFVMVSNDGDVVERMTADNATQKGWFLDELHMTYEIQSDKLFRVTSVPETENASSTVVSTLGFSVSATTPSDPTEGLPTLNATFSQTEGVSRSISDWEVVRVLTGSNDVEWVYQSQKPFGDSEWITDRPREKARLDNPNNISRFGLDFTTEGLWRANESTDDTIRILVKRESITAYVHLYDQGNFIGTSNSEAFRITSGEVIEANLLVRLAWLQ